MTYIRVPRDGITVQLPVTAKNAPLGPKTLYFDMDPCIGSTTPTNPRPTSWLLPKSVSTSG